jgi:DNA primase
VIKQEVIDKILDAAHIEEVVGEFVDLKKRGSSLIGLCPFHNEKTPSFNVSVSKGIYKCFGCGMAGDSVKFIMDHEKYSYPEALRFLAKKYHIEIEEEVSSQEEILNRDHRESLLVVTNWASEFFKTQLWETEEGQTIGLDYFRERGFRDDIIKKYGLGYSPEAWSTLTDAAKTAGYQDNYLAETGLIVQKEDGRNYDRFRGRVMFPIHNLSGRVLGFGGRTLKTDKQTPKYVNSPESEIYHKSNVLYGLYFAKKAISQADQCLLVEGYMDVLALHQAGIEQAVASSGTSLTSGQIRLIARYTKNVTILFDGDAAGIKAALRGIDMLLEEGLNVKILLIPDGEDPDSYLRKYGSEAFKSYLQQHQEDFISFKTNVLLADAGDDPIKRANTIREVVESIALIPDQIKASVFIRECSSLLEIEERVLLHELNKLRVSNARKKGKTVGQSDRPHPTQEDLDPLLAPPQTEGPKAMPENNPQTIATLQEREFIRVLLNYGRDLAHWETNPNLPIAPLLINSILDIPFTDPVCARILKIYQGYIAKQELPEDRVFTSHTDKAISELAITLLSPRYEISPNWNDDKRKIYVPQEHEHLQELVYTTVFRIKKRWVESQMHELREELKTTKDEAQTEALLQKYQAMKDALKIIGERLGTIILK